LSDLDDCATLDHVPQPPSSAGPPADPDPLQEALREVLTLTALARAALARRLGLAVHDVEAVEHVMLADEPVGPVQLSRRLGVTSAAATQAVHRLQAAGHVVRTPHPDDGRRQVLQVTPSGVDHVMSELGPLLALSARASDGLSERDCEAVLRFLHGIADACRAFLDPADRPPRG